LTRISRKKWRVRIFVVQILHNDGGLIHIGAVVLKCWNFSVGVDRQKLGFFLLAFSDVNDNLFVL